MKFRVASTAFDPGARTLFYTDDNYDSWRDLMAVQQKQIELLERALKLEGKEGAAT